MSAAEETERFCDDASPSGGATGLPDEWAYAPALRDLEVAQQGLGRCLAEASLGQEAPPAVDWFLGGTLVNIRDRATLVSVLDDVQSLLEAGAEPTVILGALNELAVLGALHASMDRANGRAVLQLCEIVNGLEMACGRRAWHWELRRTDQQQLALEARWDRGEPPAWWSCGVTRLLVCDGRLIDERLRPWGTLWVSPRAAARTLADAELWLGELSDETGRAAQS